MSAVPDLTMMMAITRAAIPTMWIFVEKRSLMLVWQLCKQEDPSEHVKHFRDYAVGNDAWMTSLQITEGPTV